MKILNATLAITLLVSSVAYSAPVCRTVHSHAQMMKNPDYIWRKKEMKKQRQVVDRNIGLIQLTTSEVVPGQKEFKNRPPADQKHFIDPKTGEVHLYGTQVDSKDGEIVALVYKNMEALLTRKEPKELKIKVTLPNGKPMIGQEAVWDVYRISYNELVSFFGKEAVDRAYRDPKRNLDPGTDLFYGGIALQENGDLGRWTTDNYRRRVHAMGMVNGSLKIIEDPLFNQIPKGTTEKGYAFGGIPALPGNYIGHAYGPNIMVDRDSNGELVAYMVSEEVTRRIPYKGRDVEVTEIVARRMISPFETSQDPKDRVLLVDIIGPDGQPYPEADRGPGMSHTLLFEGFRPVTMNPDGTQVTTREVRKNGKSTFIEDPTLKSRKFYFLVGSSGNFAGDDYDARVAWREGSPIGPYKMMTNDDGISLVGLLEKVKELYQLSWAGRPDFIEQYGGWMAFHAVDKDIIPDGEFTGVIPKDTKLYVRGNYIIAAFTYIDFRGEPRMKLLVKKTRPNE